MRINLLKLKFKYLIPRNKAVQSTYITQVLSACLFPQKKLHQKPSYYMFKSIDHITDKIPLC